MSLSCLHRKDRPWFKTVLCVFVSPVLALLVFVVVVLAVDVLFRKEQLMRDANLTGHLMDCSHGA